ncbi:restriction endonuclease [Phenylobacterium sp.]|uniref:restriction endonuclease n=1 Tax=Phenylobacterium sp. TaxID=1871053 RepID=UPI00286E6B7E|nr:restriction endonuclease [Phenylobacterium sp.]
MQQLEPTQIRYVKLGQNGAWLSRCIAEGVIELGYDSVPHELAAAGDWATITKQMIEADGRSAGKATSFTREVRDFYTLGSDALWVTIGQGRLWWAFADPEVIAVDEDGRGARARKTLGGWSDQSLSGERLELSRLSTRLTKVAAYQQTICRVGDEDYLLRRLNGVVEPVVQRARAAQAEMVTSALDMIRRLDWRDFELLVDLIFAGSGWRRSSAVGGSSQADTDLILEQAVTGERAFVQVKSSASAATLRDYVQRFADDPSFDRLFFLCHSPGGALAAPEDPRIQVWLGPQIAEQAVKAGLLEWLIEKVR